LTFRRIKVSFSGVFDAPSSAETDDPREQRAQRRLRALEELTDICMAVARALGERALEAAAAGQDAEKIALTLSRVSRSVRLTVALEEKLDAGRKARAGKAQTDLTETDGAETGGAETGGAEQWADAQRHRDQAAAARAKMQRALVSDALTQAIEAEAPEREVENLLSDLYERLDDPSDDAEFANRPVGERVCRDLGLIPSDGLGVQQAWAAEPAEAGGLADRGGAILKAALANVEPLKLEVKAALNARLARIRSP
jgi:hypothetical protein